MAGRVFQNLHKYRDAMVVNEGTGCDVRVVFVLFGHVCMGWSDSSSTHLAPLKKCLAGNNVRLNWCVITIAAGPDPRSPWQLANRACCPDLVSQQASLHVSMSSQEGYSTDWAAFIVLLIILASSLNANVQAASRQRARLCACEAELQPGPQGAP